MWRSHVGTSEGRTSERPRVARRNVRGSHVGTSEGRTSERPRVARRNVRGSHVGTSEGRTSERPRVARRNVRGSHVGTSEGRTSERPRVARRNVRGSEGPELWSGLLRSVIAASLTSRAEFCEDLGRATLRRLKVRILTAGATPDPNRHAWRAAGSKGIPSLHSFSN